ncbi:MAG: L-2-hydroxyglutarate oxidase [Chitinophagaceae bacterium]|nr:MAG: L-2-hydroxyglutarate oxidase [Chitinophagaceae bacterium]
METFDIIIVGGGIVGLGTAYKISQRHPGKSILLLEKEDDIAKHQTGRNSGVIHSGIYYKPGSLKARNCVDGRRELVAFAKEHNIPHDICGKIIVATDAQELPHMYKVFKNGQANSVEGIELINKNAIKEIEPFCEGFEGIWVPCTGIIDFVATTKKLRDIVLLANSKNRVLTGHEALSINRATELTTIITNKGPFSAKHVIFCGGLHSDRLAKKDDVRIDMEIVGFRGDYYDLTEKGRSKVRNLIYPVPNPKFPFLGVHFTRMTDDTIECGPNAVFVFKREGYNKTDFSGKDTYDALRFGGTWKFFKKNWRFGIDEYKGAFSKKLFLTRLQKLIPSLELDDIVPSRSGVRAMALSTEGEMIDDFKIVVKENSLHVLNAPSPAATYPPGQVQLP